MEVISRNHRRAYMQVMRAPLYQSNNSEEVQDMKRHRRLLLEKSFTSAGISLKDSILNSDASERYNLRSAPVYKIRDLGKYQPLLENYSLPHAKTSFLTQSSPQFVGSANAVKKKMVNLPDKTQTESLRSPSFYKVMVSSEDGTIIKLTKHITMDKLCDTLKDKGLGDPRDRLPQRKLDPVPLLKKRKRQENRYPFYKEKLRGRALLDMDNVNVRASAFIEQQKESSQIKTIRTASANWRARFQVLNLRDASEVSFGNDDLDNDGFEDWDEDSKPRKLTDETSTRINTWIDGVHTALKAVNDLTE